MKRCGTPYSTTYKFDIYRNGKVYLTYDASLKSLYICSPRTENDVLWYDSIDLKTFFYGCKMGDLATVTGFLDAKNYKEGDPLSDVHYEGPSYAKTEALEYSRNAIAYLVCVLENITEQIGDDINLTMSDIGFKSY